MTNPVTPPLPASGGSYIRNADGSLTPEVTAEDAAAPVVMQEPAKPASRAKPSDVKEN